MLRSCFSCADVAFTHGFVSCFECFTSSLMWSVFPGDSRDEIACRATEDTQGRVCYTILWYIHSVSVLFSLRTGVVGDESFHRLHSHLL